MSFEPQIGMKIDEEFIENTDLHEHVWLSAHSDFNHIVDEYIDKEIWDLVCDLGGFGEIWERDHEYKDAYSKLEEYIKSSLEYEDLYFPSEGDGTECMNTKNGVTPVVIDSENIDTVELCIRTAAMWIIDAIVESWRVFLQIENVELTEKTGKEEFGPNWISNDRTRITLMKYNRYQHVPDLTSGMDGFNFHNGSVNFVHSRITGSLCFSVECTTYGDSLRDVYV